ncbi:DUF4959 domain-containing protein [Membranicola marinus]|uniref:DUF4959 domain-containing protein n=1 Tax=Membranihabitans marinus TaxID=1227546 RepID=A0A953L9E6_9BACT|nr:DUF5000 domain-containing lipoprotein [Membranihabitans marinus]MBY5958770.1 DUF4959 domain-containing protein [Membranihabitans marinus]
MNGRFICFILISYLLIACDAEEKKPLVDVGGQPQAIFNIRVENKPGGAKIYYSLPDDPSMLYVMAEYRTTDKGDVQRVKSSVFKNFIELEGFGREQTYQIKLYGVNRAEHKSTPVDVTIHPERPYVHSLYDSLKVSAAFGGVAINLKNIDEVDNVVHISYKDSIGEWVDYDRYYSNSKEVYYAVRGFEAKPTQFAFWITDKWQNSSDTLFAELTPLYEEELDKSLWKDAALLDDFNDPLYGPLSQLWTPGSRTYFFQNKNNIEASGMPTWITIDLGKNYFIGRMKLNQVSHSNTWRYGSCSPRLFQIYGSNSPSTDWNKWDLLGDFESIKPSELPVGQLSDADLKRNAEGEDFSFQSSDQSYRYVRFKALETWGNVQYMCALELTLWGQVDE